MVLTVILSCIVHSEKINFVLILIYQNNDDPSTNILLKGNVCFKISEFVFFFKDAVEARSLSLNPQFIGKLSFQFNKLLQLLLHFIKLNKII